MGLDDLLDPVNKRPTQDLVMGMECLLLAFVPELAGKSLTQVSIMPVRVPQNKRQRCCVLMVLLQQVVEWYGLFCRKTISATFKAMEVGLVAFEAWAGVRHCTPCPCGISTYLFTNK